MSVRPSVSNRIPSGKVLVYVVVALVLAAGAVACVMYYANYETRTVTDISPAESKNALFESDRLEDKTPAFDDALVDRRTVKSADGSLWQVNSSAAVYQLDLLDKNEQTDRASLLKLYPTYAAAALAQGAEPMLPSINVVDAKGKQFDDGMYAAIEHLVLFHEDGTLALARTFVNGLFFAVSDDPERPAWLWSAVALHLGGFWDENKHGKLTARISAAAKKFQDEPDAKPISFYTWNDELRKAFIFLRYLQQDLRLQKGLVDDIVRVYYKHPEMLRLNTRLIELYAKLTNPMDGVSVVEYHEKKEPFPAHEPIALLPSSTSRENELFKKVPSLSAETDLMKLLVDAIRSGKVDLKPKDDAGWYAYQVYALETLLLPERGAESQKLLLTKKYKLRLLEAFKAAITQRRETHARQMVATKGEAMYKPPLGGLAPRLRIEPNPTYLLRQARAYAFLENVLLAVIPESQRAALTGLRANGKRAKPLFEELAWMKSFFYGLHLLCCEDLGMQSLLLADELTPEARAEAEADANAWLRDWVQDPDLDVDSRVCVPVYVDLRQKRTQYWATLGVEPLKLEITFARKPSWRAISGPDGKPLPTGQTPGAWSKIEDTKPQTVVILGAAFAEFQREGLRPLDREEYRKLCDGDEPARAALLEKLDQR